jgi:signal transduction histidine kinase
MSLDWQELIRYIAHDTRALIRKGLSNAQFLERKLGPGVDGDVSAHLRAIIEAQNDLNSLFVRLVALADVENAHHRTPKHAPRRAEEAVALEVAVLGAELHCQHAILRVGAELVVGHLPDCSVPPKTQVVLTELIDNALRFGHPARPLRVVVEADTDDRKIRVRVSDNGTGVDAAYADKLFQPLQRLDARRSGFGLGLAISRAIVESAGGRIYLEQTNLEQTGEASSVGARFVFEVPNHASQ